MLNILFKFVAVLRFSFYTFSHSLKKIQLVVNEKW